MAMDYYRKTGIVLPVVAVLLSVTVMLRAQDGVPEMPEDTLCEVVVTADRIREIVPAQKLAGQQLERLRSNSVADALRYFSGVQVKDYGGIGGLKTVNVRSLGSQHVGVFYDGIQISNAQNGTVDLGKFSMDNMEVLSVYNGQKSDIFQSARDYASAAALYMVSRGSGRVSETISISRHAAALSTLSTSRPCGRAGRDGGSAPPPMSSFSILQGVTSFGTAGKEDMTPRKYAGTGM